MNEVEALASPSVFSNPSVMWMAFFMILLGVAVGWLLFKRKPDTDEVDKLKVKLGSLNAELDRVLVEGESNQLHLGKMKSQIDGHQTTLEAERAQAAKSIESLRDDVQKANDRVTAIKAKTVEVDEQVKKSLGVTQGENNRLVDENNALGAQLTAAEAKAEDLKAAMKDQASQIAALKGNQMPDDVQKIIAENADFKELWHNTNKHYRKNIKSAVRRAKADAKAKAKA